MNFCITITNSFISIAALKKTIYDKIHQKVKCLIWNQCLKQNRPQKDIKRRKRMSENKAKKVKEITDELKKDAKIVIK